MNVRAILNRQKNRLKDLLVRHKSKRDTPHTETHQQILQALPGLSFQERESLFLELRKQLAECSETIAYAERIFNIYSERYQAYSGSLQGIRILELGPGINVAAGIYFLLAGASKYVAVDALAAFPERPREFYQNLFEELKGRPQLVRRKNISDDDLREIVVLNESLRWNPQRIEYLTPVYADRMPFPDEYFHYIYSNASFEHFERPENVLSEIFRVLNRGALTAHTIDLRDHIDFSKPLEFLKFPPQNYPFASPYGTNRWRSSDFEKAFRSAGFEIEQFATSESRKIPDEEYQTFDQFFKNNYTREDLEILGITVVARKS